MKRDEELCVHGGGLTGKEGSFTLMMLRSVGGAEEDREERRRAD